MPKTGEIIDNGRGPRSLDHVVEEFVPSSAWTEDLNGHYLLVDIPDFKKEEVKLQIDNLGNIRINGERLVNNKYIYFEQTFKVPENSDIDGITGKFDGEILYLTVPKRSEELDNVNNPTLDYPNNKNDNDNDDNKDGKYNINEGNNELRNNVKGNSIYELHKVILNKLGEETPIKKAMEMIMNNKGILVTALLAFSLGVIVSRTFESGGHVSIKEIKDQFAQINN